MGQTDSAAAKYVDVSELVPWADNPRKNQHAIAAVAASIQRFGFASPIIARPNGEIIAGHTRLKAAISLGWEKVPVRFLDLTADQAHALALADNRLGELADWDADILAGVLEQLKDVDPTLIEVTGWADEMDALFGDLDMDGDPGSEMGAMEFKVVVDVVDEHDQKALVKKLETEGYTCQALIS